MPFDDLPYDHRLPTRRDILRGGLIAAGMAITTGCTPVVASKSPYQPELIIGQRGLADGRFQKPRAMAVDSLNRMYVIDKTARVQCFDEHGNFVRGWRTPELEQGKPTGITVDRDGTLIIADTHYFRFLFYTPQGEWLQDRTIGGVNGPDPGQFAFVTDIVRTPSGEFLMGEYGEFDRIHKYSSDGKFIDRFGEHGDEPLQFSRPQSLAIDRDGLLWVADACNHRIQVIDWRNKKPELVKMFGMEGEEPGQLRYPYAISLLEDGLVVGEYGNHRVQKFDFDGTFLASWGSIGNLPGQLIHPWAVATDKQNRIYVADSGNNRVQRFLF